MNAPEVFRNNTYIEDAEFDRVKEMIGEELRILQFDREASLDTIRHYAQGLGATIRCDEEYARKYPYGEIVAPPTFPIVCFLGVGAYQARSAA